jgi:hypothetical protein
MAQQYPPPPSTPARGQRPGAITAVGVLLIISGAFAILLGLLSFGIASVTGFFSLLGILLLPIGALEIYAGIQVLNLKEVGRVLGMIAAGAGLVIRLIYVVKSPTAVVGILIDAFIIYTLYSNKQYFSD